MQWVLQRKMIIRAPGLWTSQPRTNHGDVREDHLGQARFDELLHHIVLLLHSRHRTPAGEKTKACGMRRCDILHLTTVATHPFVLFTSVNCCELSVMAFFKVMCVAVALSDAAVGATVLLCPH